jgi:hypothetical protein
MSGDVTLRANEGPSVWFVMDGTVWRVDDSLQLPEGLVMTPRQSTVCRVLLELAARRLP